MYLEGYFSLILYLSGYKKFGRDGMGGKIKNEAGSLKVGETFSVFSYPVVSD